MSWEAIQRKQRKCTHGHSLGLCQLRMPLLQVNLCQRTKLRSTAMANIENRVRTEQVDAPYKEVLRQDRYPMNQALRVHSLNSVRYGVSNSTVFPLGWSPSVVLAQHAVPASIAAPR